MDGSRAANASLRCPSYPCEFNVIPQTADNPHDVQSAGYPAWWQCHQEVWVGDFDPAASGDKLVNVSHRAVMDFGLWYAARGTVGPDPTQHVISGWIHTFDGHMRLKVESGIRRISTCFVYSASLNGQKPF